MNPQVGIKSHVLSDWAAQCVASGRAQSRTDGREERQFVHVCPPLCICVVTFIEFASFVW